VEWCGQGFGMVMERSRGRRNRIRVRSGAFIGRQGAPRHDVDQGELASERRSRPRRRGGLHAPGRDEDELVLVIFRRRGNWAVVAGLVLGCLWAACWAGCWARQQDCCGQASLFSLLFSVYLFSVLYFLFNSGLHFPFVLQDFKCVNPFGVYKDTIVNIRALKYFICVVTPLFIKC
jgi:hypothetical protein